MLDWLSCLIYLYLRWLDTVFSGSIRRHKQWFEKIATTVVLDKDKNLLRSGRCSDIGVIIATKWRYYLFYLQEYISALGTALSKSFTIAFSSNSRQCLSGLSEICKSVVDIFWDEVFMARNTVKNDNLDVWPLSVENEALLTCNFTS